MLFSSPVSGFNAIADECKPNLNQAVHRVVCEMLWNIYPSITTVLHLRATRHVVRLQPCHLLFPHFLVTSPLLTQHVFITPKQARHGVLFVYAHKNKIKIYLLLLLLVLCLFSLIEIEVLSSSFIYTSWSVNFLLHPFLPLSLHPLSGSLSLSLWPNLRGKNTV